MQWFNSSVMAAVLMLAPTLASGQERNDDLLHFGNMGGILPSLEQGDLPQPNSLGAKLLSRYCSQCHNVPGPGMRTEDEWNHIYWKMVWRMHVTNSQFRDFLIPKYDESKILYQYLIDNALDPIKSGDVDTDDVGANEFIRTCMQCHELPDPKQHTKVEWRNVVGRMKRHIKSMGKRAPNDSETSAILEYLREHGTE